MFFKKDPVSGRVTQTTQTGAYSPEGLKGAEPKASEFKFSSSTIKPASVAEPYIPGSGAEPRGVVPQTAGYEKIRRMQRIMTAQDGLLVWQKLGMRDKIPYWGTYALIAVCMGLTAKNLWAMSWPKPTED